MIERLCKMALVATVLVGSVACGDNPVGRKCFLGVDAGGSQSVVASPALECPSRTCLHTPQETDLPTGSEYSDLCTAECKKDSDCDKVPESPCVNGFTCGVAVTTGPFCCRKLCMCRDYLIIPDGGLRLPAACDPTNPDNVERCSNVQP